MLKDQRKWKMPRNPTINLESGSSKRSNFEAEKGDNETVGIGERPGGLKDPRGGKLQREGEQHHH